MEHIRDIVISPKEPIFKNVGWIKKVDNTYRLFIYLNGDWIDVAVGYDLNYLIEEVKNLNKLISQLQTDFQNSNNLINAKLNEIIKQIGNLNEAPMDGKIYGRKNGKWVEITSVTPVEPSVWAEYVEPNLLKIYGEGSSIQDSLLILSSEEIQYNNNILII